ncbi:MULTISPECIES: EVE domain-containing protein [unclassified Bradyrhizobium]|uniref:EVE domain-containing protein n=1 Tax=unclassified Bradyrhizobium TaxID=2631580 RepID=UPI003397D564
MQTWIFQGNPDQFDVDAYLATSPTQLPWLVTRYAQQIEMGDRVFIWRTKGSGEKDAGIIAETTVVAPAIPRPESAEAVSFWRADTEQATQVLPRALLRLNRFASKKEVLRRDWLAQDPILSELPNLKMAAGTNYPVTPEQASRLYALWSRTGQDWSRDECVAGLWAYVKTLRTPVSRLPGSPVAIVSQLTGRAVPGVYNKVMNFRSIDPRDERAGLPASAATDERVWNEFFDPAANELREAGVEEEFNRLWMSTPGSAGPALDAQAAEERAEAAARRLEDQELDDLLARYQAGLAVRPLRPRASSSTTRVYDRDPLVIAIARKRAGHRCEVPGCNHPPFLGADGLPYCEVHHVIPLAEGGEDRIENAACLCPSHHREVHLGSQRNVLEAQLKELRAAAL